MLLTRRGMTLDAWLTEHNITTLSGAVAACRAGGTYMPASLAAAIDGLLRARTEVQEPKNVENSAGVSTIVVSHDSAPRPGLVTLASGRPRRRRKDVLEVVDTVTPHADDGDLVAPFEVDREDERGRSVGSAADAGDDAPGSKGHTDPLVSVA